MKFAFLCLTLLLSVSVGAQINEETHDFSFEYGLMYHTLRGEQKANNSKGRLTSDQNPYWNAAYTYRMSQNSAVRFFGGIQIVRFNEPQFGSIKKEDQVFDSYGLEIIRRMSPIFKASIFAMSQDHPTYFARTPTEFEIVKKSFIQSGMHFALGQRRRIGLLWGTGVKGYFIFPTKGGEVITEAGAGGEAYARLGWVGPFGALYQGKGFYQVTTAPNAAINFTHESLGYCFQVSHSF